MGIGPILELALALDDTAFDWRYTGFSSSHRSYLRDVSFIALFAGFTERALLNNGDLWYGIANAICRLLAQSREAIPTERADIFRHLLNRVTFLLPNKFGMVTDNCVNNQIAKTSVGEDGRFVNQVDSVL